MKLSQDDILRLNNADAAELDPETSSEAGWSVRDNPIASEESYRSDSSDDEMDYRRKGDDFPRLRKVGSLDSSSPREIHMIVPEPKTRRSFNDGATSDPNCRARNPEATDGVAEHICTRVLAGQTVSSKTRTPGSGLSNMVHKDELNRDNVCSTCACKRETDGSVRSEDAVGKSEVDSPSPKEVRRWQPFRMVWKRLRWCTEAALGGSLFLVLALPLAMVLGKALNGSRDYHDGLVPT